MIPVFAKKLRTVSTPNTVTANAVSTTVRSHPYRLSIPRLPIGRDTIRDVKRDVFAVHQEPSLTRIAMDEELRPIGPIRDEPISDGNIEPFHYTVACRHLEILCGLLTFRIARAHGSAPRTRARWPMFT